MGELKVKHLKTVRNITRKIWKACAVFLFIAFVFMGGMVFVLGSLEGKVAISSLSAEEIPTLVHGTYHLLRGVFYVGIALAISVGTWISVKAYLDHRDKKSAIPLTGERVVYEW